MMRQETTDSGVGPSTVVGQTGQLGRFVAWIVRGWTDLQTARDDWLWMRKSFTLTTTASDGVYSYSDCIDTVTLLAIARWARWYKRSFKCYLQADGVGSEYPLIWMEWEDFRRTYRYGAQTDGPPVHVSQDPAQNLVLGPVPDDVYVVSGDYQRSPQILAVDADVPECPARFHDLIVYEAMSKYGANRVAPDVLLRAAHEGGVLRNALERDQLPPMGFGEPLA